MARKHAKQSQSQLRLIPDDAPPSSRKARKGAPLPPKDRDWLKRAIAEHGIDRVVHDTGLSRSGLYGIIQGRSSWGVTRGKVLAYLRAQKPLEYTGTVKAQLVASTTGELLTAIRIAQRAQSLGLTVERYIETLVNADLAKGGQ